LVRRGVLQYAPTGRVVVPTMAPRNFARRSAAIGLPCKEAAQNGGALPRPPYRKVFVTFPLVPTMLMRGESAAVMPTAMRTFPFLSRKSMWAAPVFPRL